MSNNEKREVIQSYIMTCAKYSFSIDEKRVLSHLVEFLQPLLEGKKLEGKITQDLFNNYMVEVPVSFFFDESTTRQRVKRAIKSLNDKSFEIENDNGEWQIIRLIEMPKLDTKGQIRFYLSDKLVDVFLNFNRGYTKYMLDVSLSFNSVYSMRLYELISNQSHPMTYSINRLKQIWDLDKVKAYERNYNFIQRVIIPAQRELADKSNWGFNFNCIKKGNKIEKIEFIPIHYHTRDSEESIRADALRRVNLSAFLTREVRAYLQNVCNFTAREIKNNIQTFQTFCYLNREDTLNKIQTIWEQGYGARNQKGYLIRSLQNYNDNY
jgi:plasmid replication initiation protein